MLNIVILCVVIVLICIMLFHVKNVEQCTKRNWVGLCSSKVEPYDGVPCTTIVGTAGKLYGTNCVQNENATAAKCFPEFSTVHEESRGTIKMKDIHINDKILSINKNGKLFYDKVVTFLHKDENGHDEYLKISTANGHDLHISNKHVMFVYGDDCKSKNVFADEINVGDEIMVHSSNKTEMDIVNNIDVVKCNGIYAPLTEHGMIIVDDVYVSCYAEIKNIDLAHLAMMPMIYNSDLRLKSNGPNLHPYVEMMYNTFQTYMAQ